MSRKKNIFFIFNNLKIFFLSIRKNINFIKKYLKAFFSFSNKRINLNLTFYLIVSIISPLLDVFLISYITSYIYVITSKSSEIQNIFNFNFNINENSILTYIFIIFICLLTYLIKLFATYFTYYIGAIYGTSLTNKFISAFSKISYDFYLNLKESEYINYYSENINSCVSVVNASFNFVSSLITFLIYLLYLYFAIPFNIFILLLIFSLTYYFFINKFIGKRIVNISRNINNINPIRMKKVLDFYSLYKVVKVFDLSKIFLKNLLNSDMDYRFLSAKAPFYISLPTVTVIYLFYLVGVTIVFFQARIGIFDIYLNLILSTGLIIQRIIPISNLLLSSLNTVKFKSIFLLDIYQEYCLMIKSFNSDSYRYKRLNKISNIITNNFLIRFANINYKFKDSNNYLYQNDLSFAIRKNSNLLITGPSGSGKSTLIDLILALREPSKGEITYNPKIKYLPDFLTYVPQNNLIIDGTLMDNLILGGKSIFQDNNKSTLFEILECCLLDKILKQSSLGLNQKIGNGGVKLSGGQLQRLSIARALLRSVPILLMDEPTSSLDEKTSKLLMKNLITYASKSSMSIVVVSHDLSIFPLFSENVRL